jgi:hypothetical protein
MPRKDKDSEPPRPLNRNEMRFITWFLRLRDIYKAAEKAGIPKTQAVKTFNQIEVQEEMERQQDVLRQERARQEVEIENLTGEWLDGQLRRVIKEEKGPAATDAIRLGYVAIGRIQAGQTRVLDPGGQGGAESVAAPANFYQAFMPVGVAVSPILPDPTPATVPQSAEPVRQPYKPPTPAEPAGAQPPAIPSVTAQAGKTNAPAPSSTGAPPRRAAKRITT